MASWKWHIENLNGYKNHTLRLFFLHLGHNKPFDHPRQYLCNSGASAMRNKEKCPATQKSQGQIDFDMADKNWIKEYKYASSVWHWKQHDCVIKPHYSDIT